MIGNGFYVGTKGGEAGGKVNDFRGSEGSLWSPRPLVTGGLGDEHAGRGSIRKL